MPAKRSFDVFLLERGTTLSLISQSIIQPQPAVTVAKDTQLFISQTIVKTSDNTCHKITTSERMNCIIDRIEEHLLSKGISCLPFNYYKMLPKLHSNFSQCKEDSILAVDIQNVRNSPISM